MAITRKEFEDDEFYKQRNTKKQAMFLSFLLKNNLNAYTTAEIAKEVYGSDDVKTVARTYYLLTRLLKKGFVTKKPPYWAIKKLDVKENEETNLETKEEDNQ